MSESPAPEYNENKAFASEDLITLFRRIFRGMARALHEQGHAHHAQRHVLGLLTKKSPAIQRELLEQLHVRSASLSELLAKLERNALIRRDRVEHDRRNVVITLTEAGETMAREQENELREGMEAIFAPLDETEKNQLGLLLNKLVNGLEEHDPHCGHERGRHRHGDFHEGGRHRQRCAAGEHGRGGRPHGPRHHERGPGPRGRGAGGPGQEPEE